MSQWGHDFRPSYLSLRKALEDVGRPPVLGTTATAPPHVREDIVYQLDMKSPAVVTTTFDRPNLHYEVIAVPGDDERCSIMSSSSRFDEVASARSIVMVRRSTSLASD